MNHSQIGGYNKARINIYNAFCSATKEGNSGTTTEGTDYRESKIHKINKTEKQISRDFTSLNKHMDTTEVM